MRLVDPASLQKRRLANLSSSSDTDPRIPNQQLGGDESRLRQQSWLSREGDTLDPQTPSTNEAPSIAAPPPQRQIAGFWRRLIAFVVDSVIVGAIGFLVAIPFFNLLADLGAAGRLVGFFIALLYFALPESSMGHGASIGKRLLRLQVVNQQGKTLSLEESLVRFFIFAVPWFLNGLALPNLRTPWVITDLLGVVIFGVGGTNLYLLTFNRKTRQGLHDLATKSYVVMMADEGAVAAEPVWKAHWWIAGSVFVVLGVGLAVFAPMMARRGPFPQLLNDARIVENMQDVQQAGVSENWFRGGDGTKTTTLLIRVRWRGTASDRGDFADQVAKTVLENDPNAGSFDSIRVEIIRGYDLGIAHAETSEHFSSSPARWRQRLFGDSSSTSQ